MDGVQMMFTVASREVIDAIGEDVAREIFDCLMNEKAPETMCPFNSMHSLSLVIGRESTEAIFYELMSY